MFGRPRRGARRRAQIFVVAFAAPKCVEPPKTPPRLPRGRFSLASSFPRRVLVASEARHFPPPRAPPHPARERPRRPRPCPSTSWCARAPPRPRPHPPPPSARARGPRPSNSRLAIGSPEARAFPSRDRASPLETPRTTHLARARRPTPPRAILSPPPRRTPTLTAPPPHAPARAPFPTSVYVQNGRFIPDKSNIWRDCCDGYYDWVKEHINEGAPLDEADHCGDPPLVLAAGNGHTAVCDLLIGEGADVQQAGLMRDCPLARAAHNGHLHTVQFLVEQGADVDALDIGDNTALHWAAMRGHVEIVNFLLQNGADKTFKNKQGKIPIDLCEPVWSTAWKYTRELLA